MDARTMSDGEAKTRCDSIACSTVLVAMLVSALCGALVF